MDPTIDDELITILRSTTLNIDARSQGWEYVLRLSVSKDGINHIIDSGKYIPFLLSYICQEKEDELVTMALKIVINIAAEEHGTFAILRSRKDICSYLLNSMCEQDKNINYKCYLLANMSRQLEIIKVLIDILLSSKGLLQRLVSVYCSSDAALRSQYDFLTLVFANVSRLTEGRRFLLQDIEFMTSILKCNNNSEEPESRRLGAALILRNCCLEIEYHEKLLNDMSILPSLMLPLMVPQQYEEGGEMGTLPADLQELCLNNAKGRDESLSVRTVLVEALTVLCYSEHAWRYLKLNGIYYVVRDLHASETDVVIKAAIEQLVAYFLVEEYQKPSMIDTSACEEMLSRQLEADFTKGLPDFVVKGTQ